MANRGRVEEECDWADELVRLTELTRRGIARAEARRARRSARVVRLTTPLRRLRVVDSLAMIPRRKRIRRRITSESTARQIAPLALERLFRQRLARIHDCRVPFVVRFSHRPTLRALGRYHRDRCLIRIFPYDAIEGTRSVEDLFEVFLHELAHHLEYTEPDQFGGHGPERHAGLAHSPLFHRIHETLWSRWHAVRQAVPQTVGSSE
ncbi:hypothetical protein Isop_1458 [Isosphaera pallida ATCC 43644]|uniref:Uncharacterized protein n=1 Tax=Isosphaera pallida (strain ATCC 43644 / DSM 9630 / IS1B) TaxID=575540 RepID=E8QY53_ISOPI|nr:hypothetical protein [Isosphaera pallida]ADV62043.1 hypothetical protein Isop_1458 [Isosphaera pallida ATCC 43644]